MDGAVEPLLYVDVGCRQSDGPSRGLQLVTDSMQADGVVILDVATVVGTECSAQVHTRRQLTEGGGGIPGLHAEAFGVLGDEHAVEIVGGGCGSLDAGPA